MYKYKKPSHVDIVVGCAKKDSEQMKIFRKSLKDIDPGFPYKLIVVEGIRPVLVNRNKAIERTTSNYVFISDDDTKFIQKNWLRDLLWVFENTPGAGIVGCKIMDHTSTKVEHGGVILIKNDGSPNFLKICPAYDAMNSFRNIKGRCVMRKTIDDKPGIRTKYIPKYDKIEPVWQVAGCAFLMDKRINGLFSNPTQGNNMEDLDMMAETIAKGYSIYYDGFVKIVNPSIIEKNKDKETVSQVKETNIIPYFAKWGVF